MAREGPPAVRRELEDGIAQILLVQPGQYAAGVPAFNVLRKGTLHAATGRGPPLSELLDDLEPKGAVLRFLAELYEAKRIYRKQIAAVLAVLLQSDAWRATLEGDAELRGLLPQELRELVGGSGPVGPVAGAEDVPPGHAVPAAAESPAPRASEEHFQEGELPADSTGAPVGPAAPACGVSSFDVREAIAAASANLARPALRPAGHEDARDLLAAARGRVEAVMGRGAGSLASVDLDEALTAFESFRRAVTKATHASAVGGRAALDAFGPKGLALRFLVDFSDRKRKHQSRIAATLACLMGIDSWRAAAEADAATHAAVCRLTGSDGPLVVKVGDATAVNLEAAAATVAAAGGVGTLCIHIIAAHNLIAKGERPCPSTSVRVSVAGRVKQTAVSCGGGSPRWDTAPPFIFEVPSLESSIQLEVLDGKLRKDELLGTLTLPVADVPGRMGLPAARYALRGAPQAELELALALVRGPGGPAPEAATAEPGAAPQDMTPVLERAIRSLSSWELASELQGMGQNGEELRCPAGHPVTKRKEGLRWHQKAEFWKQSSCDLCDEEIGQDATRWRCHFHCDFDICEACYAEARAGAATAASAAGVPSACARLGVAAVRLPREGIQQRSEATFFSIDVTLVGGGAPRRVLHRYSDFSALADQLGPWAYSLPGAAFPEKLLFGCTGERLEERRRGLEVWLQRVVERAASQWTWQGAVREFLEVKDGRPPCAAGLG